jgi:L-asparaginase
MVGGRETAPAEQHMHVTILTTGGTIEKTYDETDGSLRNVSSILEDILVRMRLPALQVRHVKVMTKDSLDMTTEDRDRILAAVQSALDHTDAVLIVHGTDTLEITGEHLFKNLHNLTRPVVLTGAMRPHEFRDTDAFQNMTEALLACRLVQPGVYAVLHNQALRFPGVVKDRTRLTFMRRGGTDSGLPASGTSPEPVSKPPCDRDAVNR